MSGREADGQDVHPPQDENLASTAHSTDTLVAPIIVNTVATPRPADQEANDYFVQHNGDRTTTTTTTAEAAEDGVGRQRSSSATPSLASSSSSTSAALREAVKVASRKSSQIDLGLSARPTIHRDLSQVSAASIESTESSATVIADARPVHLPPFSPVNYNAPFSTIHQPSVHSPFVRGGHPLYTTFSPHYGGPLSAHVSGSRTMDHSPNITPGLFDHAQVKSAGATPTESAYSGPYLHHLHTQVPKETYVADIEVDPLTGQKMINEYIIVDELGRGTHGKVKLGRHVETGDYVAIKIVERFPKKRRLGRLGNAEDKVKREVAILKKARHENIVALLEVIDDPARRKVYIILERVDLGEIPWRTPGVLDVSLVEARRYDRESRGIFNNAEAEAEDQAVIDLYRVRRAQQARQRLREWRRTNKYDDQSWSIELAGDAEEESEMETASRTGSSIGSQGTPELERVLSKASLLNDRSSRSQSSDLLATVTPGNALASASNPAATYDTGLRDALMGTMYGAFDDPMSPPEELNPLDQHPDLESTAESEPEATLADARVDIRRLSKSLSESDFLERASDIIERGVDPDLNHAPCMTLQAIRACFRDTLLGLMYLHFHGIIHRDIKPPNLLQTKDHRTKISDFGVSFLGKTMDDIDAPVPDEQSENDPDVDEAKELAKNVGTAAFYAPELCFTDQDGDNPPIGKAIDVWALGITLFCMVFARVPFIGTEFVVMRKIAEEEVYIPRKRLRPTEYKPDGRGASSDRQYSSFRDYRSPGSLEYEDIGDDLYDLLKALLNKDSLKRVTLEQVRDFKWVTADLPDPKAWKELSAPNNKAAGDKIEVSREDVEKSVVPLNLFDRIKDTVFKAVGISRSTSSASKGRKTSHDGSTASASSSSSNVLQYDRGRRPSFRADEPIVQALKASRDPDRPLPASLAMTPVHTPLPHRANKSSSAQGNPRTTVTSSSTPSDQGFDVDAPTPSLSTAGSVRTIRPAERPKSDYFDASSMPSAAAEVVQSPTPGVLAGANKLLKSVRDRSASRSSGDRVAGAIASPLSDTSSTHGNPSLGLSTELASGQLNPPSALKDSAPPSSIPASPATSHHSSTISNPDLGPRHAGVDAALPSKGSPLSLATNRSPTPLHDEKPPTPLTRPGSRLAHESTEEEFSRAETELLRRQIAEGLKKQEQQRARMSRDASSPQQRECPPSPDDELYRRRRTTKTTGASIDSIPPSLVPSLDTGVASPGSSVMPLMTPVSSEDPIRYEQTPATSDPSLPSVASEDHHTDPFDNTPVGTVRSVKSPLGRISMSSPITTFPKQIGDEDEGYIGDTAVDSDDDDEDDDSDSDGGLQIKSHRRPLPPPSRHVSAQQHARNRDRRDTGGSNVSKKSTRSSSINTMTKVPAPTSVPAPVAVPAPTAVGENESATATEAK